MGDHHENGDAGDDDDYAAGDIYPVFDKKGFCSAEFSARRGVPNHSSKVVGDTVTWVMKCHGHGGDAIANGKITYSGNRFEGTVEMSMDYSSMKMVNHISGQRLGDCK